MVWVVYKELGSLCVESGPKYQNYSILTAAHVIVEVSRDDSEGRRLELPTDQCYGATCVPASVDE